MLIDPPKKTRPYSAVSCSAFYGDEEWPCKMSYGNVPGLGYIEPTTALDANALATLRRRFWVDNLSVATLEYIILAVLAFTMISIVAVSQQLLHWAHPLLRIGFTVCCGIGVLFIVGILFGMLGARFWD